MTLDLHNRNKQTIGRLRTALYDSDAATLKHQLREVFALDARAHLAFPFEDVAGPDALFDRVYGPLLEAVPDLERRDYIVMAGPAEVGDWVGCAGFYTGVFERPWLDIPATRRQITMRYCEFFRLADDEIVEMQALWDLPAVMMQAGAWPLAPSLGVELLVPGPASQDGIVPAPRDGERSQASLDLVGAMLDGLGRFAAGGAEAIRRGSIGAPTAPIGGGISRRRISSFGAPTAPKSGAYGVPLSPLHYGIA